MLVNTSNRRIKVFELTLKSVDGKLKTLTQVSKVEEHTLFSTSSKLRLSKTYVDVQAPTGREALRHSKQKRVFYTRDSRGQ